VGSCGLDSPGTRYGLVAISCEHGYEPSVTIKVGGFSEQLSDSQLLNMGSAVARFVVFSQR
jgi:hypothetical protein